MAQLSVCAVEEAALHAFNRRRLGDCGKEASRHPLNNSGGRTGVSDQRIASRQRSAVEMIESERIALQLKLKYMQQCPACRLQRLFNAGPIQKIALAGRDEALYAMPSITFNIYPPRTPREVRRWLMVSAVAAILSREPKWARIRRRLVQNCFN